MMLRKIVLASLLLAPLPVSAAVAQTIAISPQAIPAGLSAAAGVISPIRA